MRYYCLVGSPEFIAQTDAQSRVKNPVQNPSTAPKTMANCSRAIKEPRTSGGLISAMYKGDNMLHNYSSKRSERRK